MNDLGEIALGIFVMLLFGLVFAGFSSCTSSHYEPGLYDDTVRR